MKRSSKTDWRTNVSRGATSTPITVSDEMANLALKAASCVDAEIAGVDFLPAQDGRILAIEVNAVPGWRALGKALDIDVADRVLSHLNALVENRSRTRIDADARH